jgi:ABC-2 type transport system permease protein
MVILKGSGLADITRHFVVMIAFALVINTLAIWNYKKTA